MPDNINKAIPRILGAGTMAELLRQFDLVVNVERPEPPSREQIRAMLTANALPIDPDLPEDQLTDLLGSTISTVVGPVRFGRNQGSKLAAGARVQFAGWIRPTLSDPLMVFQQASGDERSERGFSYVFINGILDPRGKVTGFASVTVQQDGDEVVISSHHAKVPKISKLLATAVVIHRRPGAAVPFLDERRVEDSDRITLLELRTGRPATGTPIASIVLGDSSVPLAGLESNYLDAADPLVFRIVDVQFEPLGEDEFDHGRVSYVATVKGASVRTAFKLIEANALIASNGLDGKPNGAYPQELQPRDRTRVASVMQITKLSRSLQPARLTDSGLSSQGAPIIGPDKVVESGNGRSMAIIKAYAEGNAGEYRQYLEDNAELYGFTPTQVKAFSSPVLVRVRLDEVDRAQFAKDSNVSDMQAMSPTEQARIDAEAMDEGVMALFSPGASGDFLAASNRPFVSAFLAKLTSEQAAGLLTPDGRPTRQVIDRIRAAVFAKAYQHEDLLRLAVEEPDPEIRNVLSALTNAAPQFVTMRTLSGEAHKQTTDALAESVSLTKTLDEEALSALVDATTIVRAARDAGQSVEEYLKQGDMFGGADPQAAALASFIAANNRSVKRMAEAFTVMAEEICQILEHKGQVVADMFGEPPVDLVTVLARVNDHMAELYGEKGGIQVGMFDAVATDLPTQVRAARAARIVRDAESVGQVVALFDMMTSNKEGQFERDAGEFERQIRALSLSVITRPREEAITDAAIRHMNKQQVLAELDRNPEYQALTPAQREGLSDVMARSAGNIVDAGGFHYDIRTYEAVTAYIEQQRGQPGYQEAVSAAVSLYRHYAKLLRESGNKPLVQGVAPLRAMVDELTGVMPESEAAKMVAGTKVRISAASLAPGYDMATMKSDMARFYQVVSGQMGTPELVRKKKRAYASLENNHINSGEGMTKTTLWHEMGHFVEYKNPELLLAAKQLLARRSDAIPSEKGKVAYLKHMTGVKSYNNEVAVNDGFYHPYVGKIYGAMGIQGVETTEVFSMGFQALTTDVELAKLAMADPEHLAMVMAAIKMLGIKYKEAK